jgi:cytochrome P450
MEEGVMGEVTVTSFDEVSQVLRRKVMKQALYDEGGVVMRDVLLTLHGEAHRERRRLENRLFRRDVFAHFDHDVVPPMIDATLKPFIAAGRGDLVTIGHRATLNLTAEIAGVDRPTGTVEELERLYGFDLKFSDGATLVHSTRDHEVVRAEVSEALEAFDVEFLAPSVARRRALISQFERGEIGEDELPRDVLTVLLRNQDALDLPHDVVRREVAFYLQAGSHSSANAFAHAMDDLFTWLEQHPEDEARVREDRIFLQRCVHESLRLHPASPVAWRVATEDVELRSGQLLPTGTKVVLDLMAANRDPEVFGPDAAAFNPNRIPPDGIPLWGHTFGGGAHVCIGQELDGGTTLEQAGGDLAQHVFGVIPQLVSEVIHRGGRRDPDNPPISDDGSERPNYSSYPVLFPAAHASSL